MADEKWSLLRKIGEIEAKFGIPLKSLCLPLNPEFVLEMIKVYDGWNYDLGNELQELLESEAPEYPDDISELVPEYPEPGKYFDVSLSSLFGTGGYLVRKNGDRVDLNVDTFNSKFVLVCCAYAPVVYGTSDFQDLLNFCDQLYSTRDDFEVVMVAWMNSLVGADDHKQVFDHLFSGFPELCLAVPFEDSKRRAYMCNLLGGSTSRDINYSSCLVLDTEGIVLHPFNRDLHHFFGAEAFPFTEEILKDIKEEDRRLLGHGSSLEQLLRINEFSPDAVYRFNPEGGPQEEMQISALNNRHVGVYLPLEGNLIPTLLRVYEQCRNQELEFEIVVLYRGSEPKLCKELIERLLRNYDVCRRWWCLPVDTSVSLRFWRLTCHSGDCDRLLVVEPNGSYVDWFAGRIMVYYDVAGYPFTERAILERDIQGMGRVTLDSIILVDHLYRGNNPSDIISAEKLLGMKPKDIIIFFVSLPNFSLEEAVSEYCDVKAWDKNFEVVFIHSNDDLEEVERHSEAISLMPWYVCPFNATQTASLRERLGTSSAMIRFGKDGRVRSCRPPDPRLLSYTPEDTLYQDALRRMARRIYPMTSRAIDERECSCFRKIARG